MLSPMILMTRQMAQQTLMHHNRDTGMRDFNRCGGRRAWSTWPSVPV